MQGLIEILCFNDPMFILIRMGGGFADWCSSHLPPSCYRNSSPFRSLTFAAGVAASPTDDSVVCLHPARVDYKFLSKFLRRGGGAVKRVRFRRVFGNLFHMPKTLQKGLCYPQVLGKPNGLVPTQVRTLPPAYNFLL